MRNTLQTLSFVLVASFNPLVGTAHAQLNEQSNTTAIDDYSELTEPQTEDTENSDIVDIILFIESLCHRDKEHSCTDEVNKAGQNLIDYIRFKKNPFKAIERNLIRRPAKEIERFFKKL